MQKIYIINYSDRNCAYKVTRTLWFIVNMFSVASTSFSSSSSAFASASFREKTLLKKNTKTTIGTKNHPQNTYNRNRLSQNRRATTSRVVVRAEVTSSSSSSDDENKQQCTGLCDSCGLAKDEMQCDGTGRIQGGFAAIPLFSWWPIKAYRPCPGLIQSGGTYTRKGQDVDSILWGEKGRD